MKKEYIVFYHKAHESMYKDIQGIRSVRLIEQDSLCKSTFIRKILSKLKVLYNIKGKGFEWLYHVISIFEKLDLSDYKDANIVFFLNDCTLDKYHTKLLVELKRKYPNIKFVVQWLNVVTTVPSVYYHGMKVINPVMILTDDPGDAERYGWIFWMDCFSLEEIEPKYDVGDVFFAGLAKGREDKIFQAYDTFIQNGVSCSFTVVGSKKLKEGISTSRMPYSEVLSYDKYCKCILEIMQDGQVGYTCRAQEAICLNKKLLTNNQWIVNSKYYDPRYIKVFDTIGEEEISFVKKELDVDYRYDNGFSAMKLIDYFEENIN